jgi:regulatory protein
MSERHSIHEMNADLFQPEEVDRYADPKEARKKAMDYLARREYGYEELISKLASAGFNADIAEDVVGVLRDENLQSDQRFTESFVRSRISQGKGPVRIRQELKERNVPPAIIVDALEEAGEDWFARAVEVRVKKFGADIPPDFTEKARQMRFLQYRGFEQEHIQSAVQSNGED